MKGKLKILKENKETMFCELLIYNRALAQGKFLMSTFYFHLVLNFLFL